MPSDEKSTKHHDESDSDEEEELEIAPKIDIDVSKLTPLSPEVISKQVSPGSLSPFALVLRNTPRLLSTLVRPPKFVLPSITVCSRISLGCRHNRPCRTRKIDSGQGNIGGHDRALQERARAEYHDQAGLRQREGACSLSLRPRSCPPSSPFRARGGHRAARPFLTKNLSILPTRSTNAKTRHVRARGTTARTGQTRRTTRRASGQAADTE